MIETILCKVFPPLKRALYNHRRWELLKQLQDHVQDTIFKHKLNESEYSLEEYNTIYKRQISLYYRVNTLMCGFLCKTGQLPRDKFMEIYLDAVNGGHIHRDRNRFGIKHSSHWIR